jgi:hypothetical protein
MQEHVPGKPVYVHVIAARLRMDMKIAFGEVCLRWHYVYLYISRCTCMYIYEYIDMNYT